MSPQPAMQVCPICGYDDDVRVARVDDEWVMTCSSGGHPAYEWRPARPSDPRGYRTGLGMELGVYDTLIDCLTDEMVEYGVVEHRFAQAAPEVYSSLVDRYGHRAVRPSKYTASSFLGGALGQLWREELVAGVWGPATGYWSYNSGISAYARPETSEDVPILSWADFATERLGVHPKDWPALGYRHLDQP